MYSLMSGSVVSDVKNIKKDKGLEKDRDAILRRMHRGAFSEEASIISKTEISKIRQFSFSRPQLLHIQYSQCYN